MEKDNGGPAFPYKAYSGIPEAGMTMRDYFAAKAMQAWLNGVDNPLVGKCAQDAYRIADAMLEARK